MNVLSVQQLSKVYSNGTVALYGLLGVSDLSILFGFVLVSLMFLILFVWAWISLHKGTGIKG